MVYGDTNFIDENGRVIGRFPAAQTDYRRLRQGYVHVPQQAAFFRADLWRQVGPLDPSFYFAMDYDLWVRLAALAPLAYLPGGCGPISGCTAAPKPSPPMTAAGRRCCACITVTAAARFL